MFLGVTSNPFLNFFWLKFYYQKENRAKTFLQLFPSFIWNSFFSATVDESNSTFARWNCLSSTSFSMKMKESLDNNDAEALLQMLVLRLLFMFWFTVLTCVGCAFVVNQEIFLLFKSLENTKVTHFPIEWCFKHRSIVTPFSRDRGSISIWFFIQPTVPKDRRVNGILYDSITITVPYVNGKQVLWLV